MATPTAVANQLHPSMRKWPGCVLFQQACGRTEGYPCSFVEHLMGFEPGWTDLALPAIIRHTDGVDLKIGSLFSGIGGLDHGLERAGLGKTVWQVEKDAWCRSVLAKHWPEAERFEDVTTAGAARADHLTPVDVICGGFPCQDVSSAGKGAGVVVGTRSGLWFEYLRIVSELMPRVVLVENVASGKQRWLPLVTEGLQALGYGVRAFSLSAADVGAPHLRRRVFVVATDPERLRLWDEQGGSGGARGEGSTVPRAHGEARSLADAAGARLARDRASRPAEEQPAADGARAAPGTVVSGQGNWWAAEPDVGRVAHGIRGGLDGRFRRSRLRGLGNAVVPQCAEVIGRVIRDMLGT